MTERRRTILASLAGLLVALLCLPWLTLCFIPDVLLLGALNRQLHDKGLSIRAERISRLLPLGIGVQKMVLADQNQDWLKLDHARVRLQLLPLFTGKISISLQAALNNAKISGNSSVWPTETATFR